MARCRRMLGCACQTESGGFGEATVAPSGIRSGTRQSQDQEEEASFLVDKEEMDECEEEGGGEAMQTGMLIQNRGHFQNKSPKLDFINQELNSKRSHRVGRGYRV
ncbi:hypothetical protein FN846DRAFT_885968 [Sphaerosporella brunnea]|uniref:Uncharacterized protein n=1 Tax=Sphaerosporella brunnea TaxID=1250544 RepID=A0A5J5FBI4_9PEZI|nr:hypothetical protein FN846DRAFT_885968 [Sphaerosporella brunnea]